MLLTAISTLTAFLLASMVALDPNVRPDHIISVSCPIERACFLLDRAGNLLFTPDKGKTLSSRAHHVKLNLKKVRFTGLVIGWGLDHSGNLWRTRDGGMSFEPVSVPDSLAIADIATSSGDLEKGIWLACHNGLVRYINRNAQITAEHHAPMPLRSLAVSSAGLFMVSEDSTLLVSSDYGNSWKFIGQIRNRYQHLSEATPGGSILAFNDHGQVLLIETSLSSFETIQAGFEGQWNDAARLGTGWLLAGQWGRLAHLSAAHDQRIRYQPLNQAWPDLASLSVQADGRCWAAFRNGQLWTSTDGGVRWKSLGQPIPAPVARIMFLDASHGFALVGKNTIYKTESSGHSWKRVGNWSTIQLNDIFFIDRQQGWAVGNHGCLVRTMDGGASWTLDKLDAQASLYGIRFMDAQQGWVVGENQLVYKSLNGGRSWNIMHSGKGKLFDLHISSSGFGLSVGEQGSVLVTRDSGNSWAFQSTPVSQNLRSFSFLDTQRGLAGGDEGTALQTTDGGESWTLLDLHTRTNISTVVCIPNSNRCLVGGQHGLMLGGEPFTQVP